MKIQNSLCICLVLRRWEDGRTGWICSFFIEFGTPQQ